MKLNLNRKFLFISRKNYTNQANDDFVRENDLYYVKETKNNQYQIQTINENEVNLDIAINDDNLFKWFISFTKNPKFPAFKIYRKQQRKMKKELQI